MKKGSDTPGALTAEGVADPSLAAVEIQWGVRIPLRDRVQLSATLYLPDPQRLPAPTVLTLTPYIAQTYDDRGLYFAAHGYPFLTIDVRGRGNSDGEFKPLINEARDAYDVVEWLARQPYCNGKVAMWGGSYGAYAQWAAAKEFPPHLATIVPVAAPYVGVDFPGRSHLPTPYLMQWLTLVWGRTSQDKLFWGNAGFWGEKFRQWFVSGVPFRELDRQLGNPSPVFQEWVAHPEHDAYWDAYNPSPEHYAKISLPVLTITGSYDADQPGAIAHYREHLRHNPSACHCLVIGPWDHAGTRTPATRFCGIEMGLASLVDLGKLHRDWYAWTMRGGSRPDFLQKNVAYYVMGADRWRYADALEDVTDRMLPLYLHSNGDPVDVFHSGQLDAWMPGESAPDRYVYDPRDVSLAALEATVDPESRTDQRMVHASGGRQLIYHSAPFERDMEVSGFFRLSVWLAIDQPDADFSAAVYEVCLDGTALQLSSDSVRARYRNSLRTPELVRTTEPLRYDFERFMFISRQIGKGHRLRLVIGPVHSIYRQRNHHSGGVVAAESMSDARTLTVQLFHDEQHPSVLHVPLGRPQ